MPRNFPGHFYFCQIVQYSMAGYSGTPLQKKLGIKPVMSMFVSQPPELYFDWISPLPDNVTVNQKPVKGIDFVHLFVRDQKSFKTAFQQAKKYLDKAGMLWISWPKKSSKVPTDLDENIIRDFGLNEGLVDVKVCAVDETWSGLKFVFRVKDR
jgi:hypothetical protein